MHLLPSVHKTQFTLPRPPLISPGFLSTPRHRYRVLETDARFRHYRRALILVPWGGSTFSLSPG